MSRTIAFPVLMTGGARFAVFEHRGSKKGSKGLLGCVTKLPWKDVRFLAPMLAMIAFIPAGAGGIAQNANQLNQVVHNTLWVSGHFHLTVGTSVVWTFFGITYWLIPYLSKRVLTPFMNKLENMKTIICTVDMLFMAGGMHLVCLYGATRRTSYTTYGDSATAQSWESYMMLLVIGGTLLIIGIILMVYIIYHLIF